MLTLNCAEDPFTSAVQVYEYMFPLCIYLHHNTPSCICCNRSLLTLVKEMKHKQNKWGKMAKVPECATCQIKERHEIKDGKFHKGGFTVLPCSLHTTSLSYITLLPFVLLQDTHSSSYFSTVTNVYTHRHTHTHRPL